mmetsp:Transcript_38770/g.80518  ORF Transcript_38770/g.80518 Transcript_38770/m.80518 type:complete len:653 (-) Transcript_38770:2383-4341(-)|eukprot:CAMPEP_0172448840 /NCGR_PEP_ID=MMETSP1065-20121228/7761_1 /TAXON_ID=265537 /ORGANISM="Amphiprora paludosa, Strain CCMP125" /LENGTH=652 /DNA_ID=CAMNT_0013200429 /DNA_START=27 /DNA_END=1985 /DNA_ORIENTATION=-
MSESNENGKRERTEADEGGPDKSPLVKQQKTEEEAAAAKADDGEAPKAAAVVESPPPPEKPLELAPIKVETPSTEPKAEPVVKTTIAPLPEKNPAPSDGGPGYVLDRSGGPPPAAASSFPSQAGGPDAVVEEKGEISIDIAGRVIGKGGEIIRDLQARSGAQIDVDQSLPGRPRVITYRGARSKVAFAKQLVEMISSGVADSNLPIGEAQREVLIIPSSSTGKVIGRGGEMVREMQNRSHAKIDFDHSATGTTVAQDQKRVVVTGTPQAVVKAKEMILFLVANPYMEAMQSINLLVDDKLRGGGQWGSGPPYPNLPNQGSNMRPEMTDQGGAPGGGWGGAPGGGGGYGGPPAYGGPPPGAGVGFHGGPGRFPGGGGGGGGPPGGPGIFTDLIYAKKQFMGRIIGSKGVTINDLQKRSSTDIQINQDVPPGADCEITIKGSREGVDSAKQMIQQIIESGPNHPFAGGGGGGGGQSYGGGYGGGSAGGYGGGGQGYGGSLGYGGGYNQSSQQGYDYNQQQQYGGYQQQQPVPQQPSYGQGSYEQPPAYQQDAAPSYGGYQQHGMPPMQHQQVPNMGGPPGQIPNYGGGAPPTNFGSQPQYGAHMPPQQPPQPPAPAPAVLDTGGWKSTTTPDGQTYYWNERTGQTQWDKPPGMP